MISLKVGLGLCTYCKFPVLYAISSDLPSCLGPDYDKRNVTNPQFLSIQVRQQDVRIIVCVLND